MFAFAGSWTLRYRKGSLGTLIVDGQSRMGRFEEDHCLVGVEGKASPLTCLNESVAWSLCMRNAGVIYIRQVSCCDLGHLVS